MLYRLLVDYEVVEFISTLKKPVQMAIYQHLKAIQNDPLNIQTIDRKTGAEDHSMFTSVRAMPSPIGRILQTGMSKS
jgi:hypothetical protein